MMIRRFFRKEKRVKGRVLLLGDQMGPEGQYVREVKRLLSRFGLTVKWQFPGMCLLRSGRTFLRLTFPSF